MKQQLSKFVSYTVTPILLGMHWWTNHDGWLYVFGALNIVAIMLYVVVALMCVAIGSTALWKEWPLKSRAAKYRAAAVSVGPSVYLLWSEAYVTMTIYLIALMLMWGLTLILESKKESA